jgi:GT2 family glycosyltransferase
VTVTAIISAYYAQQFILYRLYNLQEQDPLPEIIVVCQKYSPESVVAATFNGVRVIETNDIPWISVAWNIGIRAATGDYVTNANSDDKLKPGALAQMADALDLHPECGVVFSNVDRLIEGENIGKEWKRTQQGTGEYDTTELINGRYIIGAMPMWRRKLGFYDEKVRVAQDYEFFARLAKGGTRFWYIDKSLGVYTKRETANEWKHKVLCADEHKRIREKYADHFI